MRKVPLAVAKDKLSEYAAAAAGGEEIIITRHGRPYAKLVAIDEVTQRQRQRDLLITSLDAHRAHMVERRWAYARRGHGARRCATPVKTVVDASAVIAVALQKTNVSLVEATPRTLRDADHLAPAIMPIEVAGGIAMADWIDRQSSPNTDAAWQLAHDIIRSSRIEAISDANDLFTLCLRYRLRGADAAYLQLALSEQAALLTGDKRPAAAARGAGIPLAYEPDA